MLIIILDTSGMGYSGITGPVVIDESSVFVDGSNDGVQLIRELQLSEIREKLIDYFDYLFKRREIVWPSRNGQEQPFPWTHGGRYDVVL